MNRVKKKDRQSGDRYYTPAWMTHFFMEYLGQKVVGKRVLCPMAGQGHISTMLRDFGAEVVTGDIDKSVSVDHHWDWIVESSRSKAAFRRRYGSFDWIIDNPFWDLGKGYKAADALLGSLKHVPNVAFLMSTAWGCPVACRNFVHDQHTESMELRLPRGKGYITPHTEKKNDRPAGGSSWFVWLQDEPPTNGTITHRVSVSRYERHINAQKGQTDLVDFLNGIPAAGRGKEPTQGSLV